MTNKLNIALAQINPIVGDIAANLALIRDYRARAAALGADLVVYPEMCVIGYPAEDLVKKAAFRRAADAAVEALAEDTGDDGPAMIVSSTRSDGANIYNTAYLLDGGKIVGFRDKHDLPNYGVFDEKRVFEAGPMPGPIDFRGVRLGLMTCEDMWYPEVAECLEETGAEILVSPHGSPFQLGKADERLLHGVARVTETGLPLIFVNQVGGQDELVFDAASYALNADRSLVTQLPEFAEALVLTKWSRGDAGWRAEPTTITPALEDEAQIYAALQLGLRDYVAKNGFPGVIIGMSGGIDSALTAAIAADALGPERVHLVMMPSRYTSDESLLDAEACARALGASYDVIAIEPLVDAFDSALAPGFAGLAADSTEENIQARVRGMLLMARSNKFGQMVLATGNKSEMSVGYATLYGDLCGGFALLKDVYKTSVYKLARWRNLNKPSDALGAGGPVIPERIITRPPTAELKADQTDQDSLPPYDELDAILEGLIEDDLGVDALVAQGFERNTVARVEHMLYIAEYKRRQAPPGVKITRRQFGRDRRYPITNRFRDAKESE